MTSIRLFSPFFDSVILLELLRLRFARLPRLRHIPPRVSNKSNYETPEIKRKNDERDVLSVGEAIKSLDQLLRYRPSISRD